jgi:hypothetical protein
MAVFSISVETNKAITATASHQAIKLTRIQVGSGKLDTSTDPKSLTDCISPVMNADLISDNLITPSANILFQIDPNKIKSAFMLSEYGVFATCPAVDGNKEFLFGYASAWNDTNNDGKNMGDGLAPSSSSTPFANQYVHQINYSTTQKITSELTVTPEVKQHAQNHILFKNQPPPVDPLGLPSISKQGISDVIPDEKYTYLWTADRGTAIWMKAPRYISSDLTLYVSDKNGNDDTALPDDAKHPWKTIQAAFDWVAGCYLLSSALVNIQIDDSTFSIDKTITINHPQGNQITLAGPKPSSAKFTAATMSGVQPMYSVVLTGADTSHFSKGGYVIITELGTEKSTNECLLCGCFRVSDVTKDSIKLELPLDWPGLTLTGITNAVVTPLSAVIRTNGNISGLSIAGGGIKIENLAVIGNGSQTTAVAGIGSVSSHTYLKNVGVLGFKNASPYTQSSGIDIDGLGSSAWLDNVGISQCQYGLIGGHGGNYFGSAWSISNCDKNGIWMDLGGVCGIDRAWVHIGVCKENGILITAGSHIYVASIADNQIGGMTCQKCNYGMYIIGAGSACYANGNIWLDNNAAADIIISAHGMVYGSNEVHGSRHFKPDGWKLGQMNPDGSIYN